jgi:hypothetical protein
LAIDSTLCHRLVLERRAAEQPAGKNLSLLFEPISDEARPSAA